MERSRVRAAPPATLADDHARHGARVVEHRIGHQCTFLGELREVAILVERMEQPTEAELYGWADDGSE